MVDGDHAREDVADLTVTGLNAREDEAIEQNHEALAAGNGTNDVGGLAGLAVNLRAIGVAGAIDIANVVSQSS